MLVKIIEHFTKTNNLRYPHRGKVVAVDTNADDNRQLGRIRCNIKGIFEESQVSRLPWIYPKVPFGMGGRPDCSSFTMPQIGSEVMVVFPFNDIYFPEYVGFWRSDLTNSLLWTDNNEYPDSYGWIDPLMQWLRVNKGSSPYVELFRTLESEVSNLFRVNEDGSLWINIPSNLVINLEGGQCEIQVGSSKFLITSDKIEIESGEFSVAASPIKLSRGVEISGSSVQLNLTTARSLDIASKGSYGWNTPDGDPCVFTPGSASSPDFAPNVTLDEIQSLEDKLNELKQLAQQIKDDADAKLDRIAAVGD